MNCSHKDQILFNTQISFIGKKLRGYEQLKHSTVFASKETSFKDEYHNQTRTKVGDNSMHVRPCSFWRQIQAKSVLVCNLDTCTWAFSLQQPLFLISWICHCSQHFINVNINYDEEKQLEYK